MLDQFPVLRLFMNSSTFGRALPKRYEAEKKSVKIASMIPAKSLMRWLIGNILYDVVKNFALFVR
jgi:hypothetical protein